MTKKKTAAATKKSSKPAAAAKAVEKKRVTLLGMSVTAVLKYMGAKGFTTEQATNVVSKLADGEVAKSTIATGLSDGKNPKYAGVLVKLSKQDQQKLKAVAKVA